MYYMVTNINIAVITPPVGLNLYTLASITKDIDMETILKGTMPYVVVELIGLLLLIFPPPNKLVAARFNELGLMN